MVQVRKQLPKRSLEGQVDLSEWVSHLAVHLDDSERDCLLRACIRVRDLAGGEGADVQDWAREGDCFLAGLDIALILAELHVGIACLVAGVLYRAVREERLAL